MNTYRVLMGLLMLGPVAGVGERLAAAVLAEERPLPGVAQQVSAQFAGRYKALAAVLALVSVLSFLPPLPLLLLHQTNLRHSNSRAQTTAPVPSTDIAISEKPFSFL